MRGDVELGGTAMKADGPDPSPLDTTSRRARVLRWADLRSVPLRAILVTIAIVVAVYLLGKLLYRLRDVVLLMLVGGVHRSRLETTCCRAAALESAPTGARRHSRDAVGRSHLRRSGGGLRLSACQQHHALRQRSARIRQQGRAREGLGRASRPQVPHRVLGAQELSEAR